MGGREVVSKQSKWLSKGFYIYWHILLSWSRCLLMSYISISSVEETFHAYHWVMNTMVSREFDWSLLLFLRVAHQFHLLFTYAVFYACIFPLQGLLNAFIYFNPKFKAVRKRERMSVRHSIVRVLDISAPSFRRSPSPVEDQSIEVPEEVPASHRV